MKNRVYKCLKLSQLDQNSDEIPNLKYYSGHVRRGPEGAPRPLGLSEQGGAGRQVQKPSTARTTS